MANIYCWEAACNHTTLKPLKCHQFFFRNKRCCASIKVSLPSMNTCSPESLRTTPSLLPSPRCHLPAPVPRGCPPTLAPSGCPPSLAPSGCPPTLVPSGCPPSRARSGCPPSLAPSRCPPSIACSGCPPSLAPHHLICHHLLLWLCPAPVFSCSIQVSYSIHSCKREGATWAREEKI